MSHLVNADDLGLDPERDRGIFEAFLAGAVHRASLLVAGPSAEAASARAREHGLPLALHLDLTETPPCAETARIPTLLRAGRKLGKHGLRARLDAGEIDSGEVEIEALAQLDRFRELVGAAPAHFDSHQHVHVEPVLALVLASVLREAGVRSTRIPVAGGILTDPFHLRIAACGARARGIYANHGIEAIPSIGMECMGARMSAERLLDSLAGYASRGPVELMCHPGYSGNGWDEFNGSAEREHELRELVRLKERTA